MASMIQLEFVQAMNDFKVMFPDMDTDVIEAVLRANQGAVDSTIDQLLAMSTDNQNERLRQEIEHVESGTPKRSSTSAAAGATSAAADSTTDGEEAIPVDADSAPLRISSSERQQWTPPLLGPLPSTFLRISTEKEIDEDEQIALLLQNEEFMAELRWNQEFMSALDSEQGREGKVKVHDDDDFKERLRHMGKCSRKKFAQLSKMFNWQGKKTGTPARHGPAPDSRLLQEEHSDDEDRPSSTAHSSTK